MLNISGSGTTVNVTNDTGGQPGHWSPPDEAEGGFMRAGREAGSDATINVTAGAVVNVTNGPDKSGPSLQIARNAGSKGTVLVDNATINIAQTTPLIESLWGPSLGLRSGDAELTRAQTAALSTCLVKRPIFISEGMQLVAVWRGSQVPDRKSTFQV